MSMYQLAQVNIARPLRPFGTPEMQEFVDNLAPVNAVADGSPGFVWRLQTPDGDATALRIFGNSRLLINMSVWDSIESLRDFVQRSDAHRTVLKRRKEWFRPMAEAYMALWWVPAGHRPTIEEAEARLTHIREHGPTAIAFTFRDAFPPPTHEEATAALNAG